jgi:hypothetical protein
VALGDQTALEEADHVLRQLEQADAVGDRRLGATDALGHIAERESELVHESGVGTGFLDRREILARDVLDEREEERVPVVALPYERGNRRESCRLGRAQTALAGDQLPASPVQRPHDDRLDETLGAHGLGELRDPHGVEAAAWLAAVRLDRAQRELDELGGRGRPADEHLETATEAAATAFRRGRQARSRRESTHRRRPRPGRRP